MRSFLTILPLRYIFPVIGILFADPVHAQELRIKIPVTLVDSIFNMSDSSLKKIRTEHLSFGMHPNATRCIDFPATFDSFMTHWTIADTGAVQENGVGGESLNGERFVWDLSGCPNGRMFYDNITSFNSLNDKDTFKIDIGLNNDTTLFHHPALYWPPVLGEYFDTCMLIRNFGLGTQTTQADMRNVSSFIMPQAQIPPVLTVRYSIYIHGMKAPPGPPATLNTLFPADGDTGIVQNPTLSWAIPSQNVYYYGLQVSTDSNFSTFIFQDTLSTNSKQLAGLQAGTRYYWRVYVQNEYGASYYQDPAFRFTTTVVSDVSDKDRMIPERFELNQNYPNPFNPATTLSFVLDHSSFVSLKIYDVFGREVRTLINEYQPEGYKSMTFDAGNLPSGVYFYRLRAGAFSETKKMLLLR